MTSTEATTVCPNCTSPRQGTFCSVCGQKNTDYRRSLPPMVGELLREAFELDGRIVRSLKLLLFKPGALSVQFSANRRADYISPVRLYIFSSLVFFFIFAQTADLSPGEVAEIDVQPEQAVDGERVAKFKTMVGEDEAEQVDEIMAREGSLAKSLLNDLIDYATRTVETPDRVQRYLWSQVVEALADPGETATSIIDNAPVAVFILLPLYALLLKLIYWRRHKYYVEHLVFALHLHAFAFLVFSVSALLPEEASASDSASNMLFGWFLVYYFLALRRYYGQSRRKTLLKYLILLGAYTALVTPSVVLMMAITVSMI